MIVNTNIRIKKGAGVFSLVFLLFGVIYGQQTFNHDFCLVTVEFKDNNDYIEIHRDDGSGIYLGPHFELSYPNGCNGQSTIVAQKPVGYKSGKKSRVKAVLETNCTQDVYVRGLGPVISNGSIIYPSTKISPNNGELVYGWKNSSIDFDNDKVKYWEKFEIQWQISYDDVVWRDVEKSVNRLYVTHDSPILSPYPFPGHVDPTIVFETLLHLGCRGANNETIEQTIVEELYNNEFLFIQGNQDKVFRHDGAGPIQYWGPGAITPQCWQVSYMLSNLNGTCGGWAAFLDDVIKIQGISGSELSTVTYNNYQLPQQEKNDLSNDINLFFGSQSVDVDMLDIAYMPTINAVRSDFYVKKWNLVPGVDFVMNDFINMSVMDVTLGNGNIIKVEEELGLGGQGNDNPRSTFENHAIVKYNNKYFDPSYGSQIFLNANDWENPSLEGFGSIIRFIDGQTTWYINWVGHLNNNTQQTIVNP